MGRRKRRAGAVVNLAFLARLAVLALALRLSASMVREAKRRDQSWSLRASVRRRGGELAVPLESLHRALGAGRAHRLERWFGLRD